MPFQKGHKPFKGAGPKKGSKQARTMAEEACARAGINPFDMLVEHARTGDLNAVIQLCKHIEPPRKALDVAIDPEANAINIVIKDYGKNGH